MLLKLILKIWPALIPITIYLFWILVVEEIIIKRIIKRKKIIKSEYEIVGEKSSFDDEGIKEKPSNFSLNNKKFIIILYLSVIFGILAIIFMALEAPKADYISRNSIAIPTE